MKRKLQRRLQIYVENDPNKMVFQAVVPDNDVILAVIKSVSASYRRVLVNKLNDDAVVQGSLDKIEKELQVLWDAFYGDIIYYHNGVICSSLNIKFLADWEG